MRGRLRVLDDDRPAQLLHVPRAVGAIRPEPGENDRHQLLAVGLGCAGEQTIDRRRGRPATGFRMDFYGVIGDLGVAIGRNDVDHAVFQFLMVAHGAYGQAGWSSQDLLQMAQTRWVDVLGDENGGRKLRWRRTADLPPSLSPTA